MPDSLFSPFLPEYGTVDFGRFSVFSVFSVDSPIIRSSQLEVSPEHSRIRHSGVQRICRKSPFSPESPSSVCTCTHVWHGGRRPLLFVEPEPKFGVAGYAQSWQVDCSVFQMQRMARRKTGGQLCCRVQPLPEANHLAPHFGILLDQVCNALAAVEHGGVVPATQHRSDLRQRRAGLLAE